jgi:16S rRNA (adenine1518-N6/adenine1519-N6)-dimethyltransferase
MTTKHRPIKSLGQNFLVDTRVQQKIVDSCLLKSDDTVIEIGPGQAAITSRVLPLVKNLIVVEKDRQLAELLKEKYRDPHLEVIQGDFLKWDMNPLSNDLVVIGNIPYYISTPIIEKLLVHKAKIRRAYLTVQLEFGQRLAAQAGNRDYGSLSCFVQYYADVKLLFKISPGSFHPRPKVDSCLISLTMKSKPEVAAQNEERLFKMIQTAFMQRRKTITNALKGFAGGIDWASLLKELSIDPQARPEDLTLLNYIEISNKLVV